MTTPLDEDNYLTIQLLSYDRPTGLTERFYFLEMSTLQATRLLPHNKKIVSTKIVAYTDDNKYLDEHTIESFKTIGDFNDFFINNPDYYIHNCNIELEDGINLGSHDDGEVSVQFLSDNSDQIIIDNIFEKYNLDKKLISILKNKPGHYIAIDKQSNITGDYKNFDDYLKNGRS
ncbi:MAG: hypothetical protein V4620_10790 [Bacteroidota bacterium]